MNKLLLAAALSLTATAATATELKFEEPTLAQYRQMYGIVDQLVRENQASGGAKYADVTSFALMLGSTWLNVHRQDAMEKAAKHGRVQATPEEAWELPYANDWIGCILYQFPEGSIFEQAHFSTFDTKPTTLVGWIEANAELLNSTEELQLFRGRLEALPDWAMKCEAIVRRQLPEGTIAV